ncbi:Senescence-specific cysteine protease SAG39 [Spatholobus suberectus]|nr:Senescence-specific cysteine protease SAG39 [Spatholobus suberectus]
MAIIEIKHLIAAFFIFWACAHPAMSRTLHESSVAKTFQQWMSQHGRSYADVAEMEKRFKIFVKNLEHIVNFNNGSCWAFSAVAAIESIIKIKTGDAFKYIIQNRGLATEANYPYRGIVGTCQNGIARAAQISGYVNVPPNNEEQLLQAVAMQPVSVSISVNNEFHLYKGGIFTGPCGTTLNHAVTAIGYGTNQDGTKYWLVKNSWGENWGEGGYMRLLRDSGHPQGLCGIAMRASYPTA